MKIDINSIKGLEIICHNCKSSYSFEFNNHQSTINSCPNCKTLWLDIRNYDEIIKKMKYALEFFKMSDKAKIQLICEEKDKNER